MSYLDQISSASRRLGRWPIALGVCLVLAAAVLVPGLGRPGLWEPGERMFADRVALPQDVDAERAARQLLQSAQTIPELVKPQPAGARAAPPAACTRTAPTDALARSLTPRAVRAGRDHISDDDAGRKLPLVLLGLCVVLATAGTAMRLAGARAGLLAAIAVLSMPLLVLQSRMLTSELGTACGASLIVYALVALSRPYRGAGALGLVLDALGATAALAAGVALGFLGGGALLGLVVPIGAFAAAGALGVPAIAAAIRRRSTIQPPRAGASARIAPALPALFATLAAAGLLGLLAWQLYDVKDPHPGIVPQARQIFGQAIVPEGCWSWALGGTWRPEDDTRFIYDSTFEQIAYGTFPWGVLAPLAMAALLRDAEPGRRLAGGLALAWAGAAWIATEAFQRKVGVSIWAGFPALAIAVGVWLDALLERRARGDAGPGPGAGPGAGITAAAAMLLGLFFAIATVDLGKDMYSFAEKVTSLVSGGEPVAYPKPSRLLLVPMRLWPLLLGAIVALAFALGLILWRPGPDPTARLLRHVSAGAAAVSIAASVACAAFWAFAWHPELAHYLSSKTIFETYRELRQPGDELVIMGDLGQAPRAYADATPETAPSRDHVVRALKRPRRVFAIAPQTELCSLHREIGEQPYFVLEERNLRNLLLSNRLDGARDRNPLLNVIVHTEPRSIPHRPKNRIVFDSKIELLGWDLPAAAGRGERFEITLYYKILQPVGASWKSFMHFDGAAGRAGNADHEPIGGRCPTSTWQPGDFIIDRFEGSAGTGAYPAGRIDVWVGFFTGTNPSFRNMSVSEAPPDLRDQHDRVKITSLLLD